MKLARKQQDSLEASKQKAIHDIIQTENSKVFNALDKTDISKFLEDTFLLMMKQGKKKGVPIVELFDERTKAKIKHGESIDKLELADDQFLGLVDAVTVDTIRARGWSLYAHYDYSCPLGPRTCWHFIHFKHDEHAQSNGQTDKECLQNINRQIDDLDKARARLRKKPGPKKKRRSVSVL